MSEQQFSQQEPEEELRKRIIAGSAGSKDYRELGGLLFLSGNSDEAVELYQQAIIMSSTNIQKAAVAVELGLLFYEMSEQAKAQTLAEDALRLLSNESDSHEMLACQGAGQSLLAHCTMVKNAESGKELIRVALETLDRVTGNGPNFEGKTTAYLDAATLHDLLGNVDEATSLCEKFLQCELHEWERISGLIVYGQALRSAGRFGEAEHKIEEALRYASKYKLLLAHLYLELGLDQRGMQCSAGAQQTFQKALLALAADPYRHLKAHLSKEIYMNLAGVYYELGDLRGVAATYQAVLESTIESDPEYYGAMLWLGRCFQGTGAHAEARTCFEKVLALPTISKDEKLGAKEDIARTFYQLREYGNALTAFKELLLSYPEDNPRQSNVIIWMGHCYEGLGDHGNARECYEEVLALPHALADDKASAREGLRRLPVNGKQTFH